MSEEQAQAPEQAQAGAATVSVTGNAPSFEVIQVSPKSWGLLLVLSIFFGQLGIDRFYAGKIGTGILKLAYTIVMGLLCIILVGFAFIWIWWLVDVILIALGKFKDSEGRVIKG